MCLCAFVKTNHLSLSSLYVLMCLCQNQPSVTLKPLCAYVLLSKPTICHIKALMCLCLWGAEGVEELEDEACLVAAALHVADEFGYVCTVVEIQP